MTQEVQLNNDEEKDYPYSFLKDEIFRNSRYYYEIWGYSKRFIPIALPIILFLYIYSRSSYSVPVSNILYLLTAYSYLIAIVIAVLLVFFLDIFIGYGYLYVGKMYDGVYGMKEIPESDGRPDYWGVSFIWFASILIIIVWSLIYFQNYCEQYRFDCHFFSVDKTRGIYHVGEKKHLICDFETYYDDFYYEKDYEEKYDEDKYEDEDEFYDSIDRNIHKDELVEMQGHELKKHNYKMCLICKANYKDEFDVTDWNSSP